MRVERKAARHRTKLEVLQVNEDPGNDTYIIDISALGMRLETPIPFAKKDLVSIKFLVPGETKELLVGGQVMWTRQVLVPSPRFIVGMKLFVPQWQLDRLGRQWGGIRQIA